MPAWDPPWEFTGDITHVRVLPGRLTGSPTFSCPQLEAKKARPGVWPVRDRKAKAEPKAKRQSKSKAATAKRLRTK